MRMWTSCRKSKIRKNGKKEGKKTEKKTGGRDYGKWIHFLWFQFLVLVFQCYQIQYLTELVKGAWSNKIWNSQIYKRRLHSSLLQVILECDENQCQVISFGNLLLSVVFTIINIFSRGVNAFDPMCNLQLWACAMCALQKNTICSKKSF